MKHSYYFLSSVSHIKNKVWTHIFHYNDSIFETENIRITIINRTWNDIAACKRICGH